MKHPIDAYYQRFTYLPLAKYDHDKLFIQETMEFVRRLKKLHSHFVGPSAQAKLSDVHVEILSNSYEAQSVDYD